MQVSIDLGANLSRFYPIEDKFLKEWFHEVILSFEAYGKTELTPYQNYAINYEFGQQAYTNKIEFDGNGGAILTTQKMVIEYRHKKKGLFSGFDSIQIIKKNRLRRKMYGSN